MEKVGKARVQHQHFYHHKMVTFQPPCCIVSKQPSGSANIASHGIMCPRWVEQQAQSTSSLHPEIKYISGTRDVLDATFCYFLYLFCTLPCTLGAPRLWQQRHIPAGSRVQLAKFLRRSGGGVALVCDVMIGCVIPHQKKRSSKKKRLC